MMHTGALGALLTLAPTPWYPSYAAASGALGLDPVEDQQLGGLLMWVGSGMFFLIATAVVFFVWASREEAANRRPVGVAR
jgi:putative membrane protein